MAPTFCKKAFNLSKITAKIKQIHLIRSLETGKITNNNQWAINLTNSNSQIKKDRSDNPRKIKVKQCNNFKHWDTPENLDNKNQVL